MKSKHSIHSAASCGLLLALLAVLPAQAFADGTPLSNLYKTNSSKPNSSARYPRPRYENGGQAYVWGDMQLDVRPGEKIICKANVADKQATCFYTPSQGVDFRNFSKPPYNKLTIDPSKPKDYDPTPSPKQPDSVKVGFKINGNTLNSEFEQLDVDKNPVDIAVEGKPGRLWAYVWDFNTSLGKVAQVKEKDYLKTSFFARLPNGHPVEIKLDNVSGDAFSVAGYRDVTNEYTQSPEWNFEWYLFAVDLGLYYGFPPAVTSVVAKKLFVRSRDWEQGSCDADKWGEMNSDLAKAEPSVHDVVHHFGSGNDKKDNVTRISDIQHKFAVYLSLGKFSPLQSGQSFYIYRPEADAYDNNARKCLGLLTQYSKSNNDATYYYRGYGKTSLQSIPLYLEKPEFARQTEMRLGNVKVIPNPGGASDACVFPYFKQAAKTELKIEGLGSKVGKGQLVCQAADDSSDRKVYSFDIDQDGVGKVTVEINKEGKYNCYVERVEQFDMNFVDAEQVGSMRMYEVMPDGSRVPLSLNWDDSNLDKRKDSPPTSNLENPASWGLGLSGSAVDTVFAVPGGQAPMKKDNVLSAYSDATTTTCVESDVNARCWGDYADKGDPNSKKVGIGNGDIVNTWTYYPVSDRFSFTLIALPSSLYPIQEKYLVNGCFDGVHNPKTGGDIDPKYKPTVSPDEGTSDGIPDVVEGRPGVKISSDGKKEVPGTDTDGDGKPNHNDKDSDGDGIPDHVECHFNPSHTGYGFVNGCEDTDHDGIPDYKDTDSDNDGVPDKIECVFALGEGTFIEGCIVSDPANKYVPDYRNPDVKGGKPGTKDTDDADGDGIPDKVENKGADPSKAASNHGGKVQPFYDKDGNVDTDNDGIPDYQDTDSDNDGIPDKVEAGPNPKNPRQTSTKPGAKPDYQNPDSDGDDIPDKVECIYSVNNIGVEYIDGCIVTGDQPIPDYRNPNKQQQEGGQDTDTDGIPDKVEKGGDPKHLQDTDGNGTPDWQEHDSDGDDIPDKIECPGYKNEKDPHVGPHVNGCPDTDGDGVPDYQDPDSDNDGIPDNVENQDDKEHKKKLDVDNDGNPDVVDSDGDGIPDYKDTDSDNDGIPDKVENKGYDPTKANTTDSEGIHRDKYGNVDTDGSSSDPAKKDGVPDYRDTDSDGDGLPDHDECHYDSSNKSSKPDDKYVDGCVATPGTNKTASPRLPDYRDPKTKIDGSGSAGKGKGDDTDGDGIPDSAEGRDYHNDGNSRKTLPGASKPDYDNTDTDGDGVPDKVECPDWNPLHVGKNYAEGCPDTDGNGVPDYRQPDSNNDGKKDGDQCNYDPSAGKCKIDPFGKDGYRHNDGNKTKFAQPGEGSNNTGSGTDNAFGGIIAGGCGCAEAGGSAPLSSGLFSLLLTALGIFGIRRRRRDDA